MKKSRLMGAVCTVLFTLISTPSHAVLIPVLGGQAYYDEDADLTWLADANVSGLMNWADANTWAAGLTVDGIGGWRLPDTLQPDASCDGQLDPGGSFNLQGFGSNCTGSEMGNMFYNVLGNTAGSLSNTGPFSNVESGLYWSATAYAPATTNSWIFDINNGNQVYGDAVTNSFYAWAVQSGNVALSSVPVPAAMWLFGSGLIGLIGIAKRQ